MAFVFVFFIICLLALLAAFFVGLFRNEMVFRYRHKLLNRIHNQIMQDMNNGNYQYSWRYEEFSEVSYDDMIFKVFKPLDSFYPRDPARPER